MKEESLITLCLLLIAVGTASAGPPRWELPRGGLAVYRTSEDDQIEHRDPKNRVPHPFSNLNFTPLVLQSELDAEQQFIEDRPSTIDGVAPWLAFDLTTFGSGGKYRRVLPIVHPFGALHCEIAAFDADQNGNQTLVVNVTRRPIELDKQWKIYDDVLENMCDWSVEGTLRITRSFDRERGVVRAFHSVMDFAYGVPRGPKSKKLDWADFDYRQAWYLRDVYDHRDADLDARVRKAIDRGCLWIRHQVKHSDRVKVGADQVPVPSGGPPRIGPDGREERDWDRRGLNYGSGRLALCLLTLLKAETPKDDPIIVDGFRKLRQRTFYDSYSIALAIMALEALYAPAGEREMLLSRKIQFPYQRKLPEDDFRLMEAWTEHLLDNHDTSVDPGYLLRFSYTHERRYDNSVTQYALLGLYSAYLCGVEIKPSVWFRAANHLLQDQIPMESGPLRLRLDTYKEVDEYGWGLQKRSRADTIIAPAGWNYFGGYGTYGGMTAAGISGLTICERVLLHQNSGKKLVGDIDQAIRAGFAWLHEWRSLRKNPGYPWRWSSHYMYYLFGLERACELSGIAQIHGWDWYCDGANLLIEMQESDGTFHSRRVKDNCFAVLFLKKAQLPVQTER